MKKSELKDLIKECVREVVFETGVIKSIVTEVAQGLGTLTLNEGKNDGSKRRPEQTDVRQAVREQISRSLGTNTPTNNQNSGFSTNPLFAGTRPLSEGTDNQNPGVDITSLPGIQNWGKIANNVGKKG
jgi:hypothetical protein|tara:strand:+ start:1967 stop:2350 length:384 start_codon:yes stop_codon:yes gene_type:complete